MIQKGMKSNLKTGGVRSLASAYVLRPRTAVLGCSEISRKKVETKLLKELCSKFTGQVCS